MGERPMNDVVTSLIHAYLDGELTDQQRRALGDWLRESQDNVDRFVAECRLHSELFDAHVGMPTSADERAAWPCGASCRAPTAESAAVSVPFAPVVIEGPPAMSPSFGSLGGFLVSYSVAAVIVAIGMLVGWAWQLSVNQEVAQDGSRPSKALHPEPEMVFVARVTGMADCVWADRKTETMNHARVPLGRKYALAAGLMEITYDTGAKVILQGPCVYKTESKSGGYLSLGRVTARVEKRGEGSKVAASMANESSLPPPASVPSALFFVRTPSATVTDLGTEFGVEVNKAGATETQVFVGKVKVEAKGTAGSALERTLLAGQGVRLEPQKGLIAITVSKDTERRFVRKMPVVRPSPLELIERLDYDDTWSANSPTRTGSYLLLTTPESLQVEHCHGNPPRSWVFSRLSAMTTWPFDDSPVKWPGFQAPGSRSGFTETGMEGTCYFGIEYGLRDDFVVQFDAVQSKDRINITIGDKPATIDANRSLSVFFRAAGGPHPEIGVYTPTKAEAPTGIRSGISTALQWHNYAVRFNLREKRLTVWVDGIRRGEIELASVTQGLEPGKSWANLPWNTKCVTVGGFSQTAKGRLWTDNFCVGSPKSPTADSVEKKRVEK
jgi:hypothetical protein